MSPAAIQDYFWPLPALEEQISLPEKFPYPFYYEPHELAQLAAQELKNFIERSTDWTDLHNSKVGKMFGVLVVQDSNETLGFLAAFSGKIGDRSTIPPFVPPFYDRHDPQGFFRKGEEDLNALNQEIEQLLQSEAYRLNQQEKKVIVERNAARIASVKEENKKAKQEREAQRAKARLEFSEEEQQVLEEVLRQQSMQRHFLLKDVKRQCSQFLSERQEHWQVLDDQLERLKVLRKKLSASLQARLFAQYDFLNARGESLNVREIFANTVFKVPPAGAGDCAGPKLLQFAFQNNLQPLAMAEFWWGPSPSSEIRKHGHFYPACRGKCEPILGHMLQGLGVEENPLARDRVQVDKLEVVYEDDDLVVINKPSGFLAVPGKTWTDSVEVRMRKQYPAATGPMIVHRLDMSTSGLMVIAKNKEVHKELQHQFLKRTIKKRYVAVLNGALDHEEGTIDLPLRVDLEDRPRQLVCYEHGKSARTHFKVVNRQEAKTRIYFFPVTGRTHQLRVHAAHPAGLNTPIVGDELYGTAADRLHLHAEEITFVHPASGEELTISCSPGF
ncbi:MAG: RluA family pseudouridine synthase [Bacteroidota bacterium]